MSELRGRGSAEAGSGRYQARKSEGRGGGGPGRHLACLLLLVAAARWGTAAETSYGRLYVGPSSGPTTVRLNHVTTSTMPESPVAVTLTSSTTGAYLLSVNDAILSALESNLSLQVQRLGPPITETGEAIQRAAFDPTVSAGVSAGYTRTRTVPAIGPSVTTRSNRTGANVGISEFFPTGTNVDVALTTQRNDTEGVGDQSNSRMELGITQALLRGAGVEYNLASLRQARLNTQISEFELRGFAETLVSDVEKAYWDYASALAQTKFVNDSLKLAEDQLAETTERITIGKLAGTELAAAQAQVAVRRENLINANAAIATARLRLLRLFNPQTRDVWDQDVILKNQPVATPVALGGVTSHVQVAVRMRPDLNQARLGLRINDLTVVQTRNGLLPKLDFFITLGGTGLADSFRGSVRGEGGNTWDANGGLNFQYPLLNRAPKAQNLRALLSRDQAEEALQNAEQLAEVDVRAAYIEVIRSKEQITATAATRQLQEESLRSETEKFQIGKSTSLLVATAQSNLLSAQIDEIRAVVSYLKAIVDLYRLEGSLLVRRGISAPGSQTVSELPPPTRKP